MQTVARTDEVAMELEVLNAELAVLSTTDRRLTASEERKRAWLVGEIATVEAERDHDIVTATERDNQLLMERQREAGLEHVRALIREWDQRMDPTLKPLE